MTVRNEKILVVQKEPLIQKILTKRLEIFGYKVFLAKDGKDALTIFSKENPDLVIIDTILPRLDCYEVCRIIRKTSRIPIIILTSLNNFSDRRTAIELGIDDYIVKPFLLKDLETKIQLLIKKFRSRNQSLTPKNKQTLRRIGDLIICTHNKKVFKNNLDLKLTKIEFYIFKLLVENIGKKLSRNMILDNVWGYTPERDVDTRIVDVHISRLRSKLEKNSKSPGLIITVRGFGYMFKID